MDYPEYKPISHWCDCCGAEIEDEDDVFEIDPNGKWCCDACFVQWAMDNVDIKDLAQLFDVPVRKAYET